MRIKSGANWGWGTITGFTSATQVTVNIVSAVGTGATTAWRLGVWSDTTGWPAVCEFHEDRLWFGGPTNNPQRVDGSNSGDYENFAPSANDGTIGAANAIGVNVPSNDVNAVRWLASDERGLLVGTSGKTFLIRASTQGEALSATNAKANYAAAVGSADVDKVNAFKSAIFVQRSGKKVFDARYEYTADGIEPSDITELAEHITYPGVVEMAYQEEPHSMVWAPRRDGVLLGCTYNRKPDALSVSWQRHPLGGYSDAGRTTGAVVESVCVIPEPNGEYDELWMVVRRYINGASKRYVEYMERTFDQAVSQTSAFFVDSGLSYSGAPTSSVTGLTHLIGETVAILADGSPQPNAVVDGSGAVALSRSASIIHVGLPYMRRGKLPSIEAGAADGTALGKKRRISRLAILFYRSLGLRVGKDFGNMDEVQFRSTSDPMGAAIPLFSGIKVTPFEGDWDEQGNICFEQTQPLPSTILAFAPIQVTNDGG